jgi:sortase (surface protein transpeptidase)
MVIAAHSSFKKEDPGTYKTVFQTLPISDPGDKIFVYRKNSTNAYDLYTYQITDSFRTDKKNTKILAQTTQPTLTTYGCYAIGSNEERRVNQAQLISTTKSHGYTTQHTQAIVDTPPAKSPLIEGKIAIKNSSDSD